MSPNSNSHGLDTGIGTALAKNFVPPSGTKQQPVAADQDKPASFEEQLDRHVGHIARFGVEWADYLVKQADRLVEEAEAKRRSVVSFADEIRRRGEKLSAELRAGFEDIRAAGRCLSDARKEFSNGGTRKQ